MIERDYLMRMIDVLAKALAKVLFHKRAFEFPLAKREITGAYKSLLGVSPEFIRSFSDLQLIDVLGKDVETAGVKCYILGALLKEESGIDLASAEDDKSLSGYTKSLSLLLTAFLDTSAPIESNHLALIDECVRELEIVEIPPHILEKLFAFYEQSGRYDKAENTLFDLVKYDDHYRIMGFAFYERLLKKPSHDLVEGGLPRNEVLDGIQNLGQENLPS